MLQLLGRWATKINITSKSKDVQLGYSIWNLTKTSEVLLFVTWLKMGDCEESKDDRTGANHCDNNLKSSRHDIFPIMLPKMSTLWRTVRKWFAENLKGRFKRCSSCQMQYSPQLGEKGSPCHGDGSRLAGPSRHPHCSKNGYSWPVDCLKFAWDVRVACAYTQLGGTGGQSHWVCVLLAHRKGEAQRIRLSLCVCVCVWLRGLVGIPSDVVTWAKATLARGFLSRAHPLSLCGWVMLPELPLPGRTHLMLSGQPVLGVHMRCYVVSALSTVRGWDSCERAVTQPKLSDPAIKSHQLRLLT